MSSSSDKETDRKHKTFLIIGPGCVLYNWLDELEAWGYFTVGYVQKTNVQHILYVLFNKKHFKG